MLNLKFQRDLLFRDIAFRLILLVCILDWVTKAYFSFTLISEPRIAYSSTITWAAITAHVKLLIAPFVLAYFFSNLHFGLALCYHYLPMLDYLACAVIIAATVFCCYLMGCNRFFLRRTIDRIVFGLVVGAGVANCTEVLLTNKATDWLKIGYVDVDALAIYQTILNFADFVLFVAVPLTVVLLLARLSIYLFKLRAGQPYRIF